MRPCTVAAGFKDRSMMETTRDLAYGERYAAGRGLDPNTFVGSSVDTILAGICVGIFQFKRTSAFGGIGLARFGIGFRVDRFFIPRHVIFLTDPHDRVCRYQDPWGSV